MKVNRDVIGIRDRGLHKGGDRKQSSLTYTVELDYRSIDDIFVNRPARYYA